MFRWRHALPVASAGNAANTIYVEFVDTMQAAGDTRLSYNTNGAVRSAHIRLIREGKFGSDNNLFAVHLAAHELLHALGMRGHVDDGMRSIMSASNGIFHLADEPVSVLHPADREALRAMYGRLNLGDNAGNLGPWIDNGQSSCSERSLQRLRLRLARWLRGTLGIRPGAGHNACQQLGIERFSHLGGLFVGLVQHH